MLIGIDEVGLGSWAGPLVVCAFAAPDESWKIAGLNDSKKVSKTLREKLSQQLLIAFPNQYKIVSVTSEEIDRIGIKRALPLAMEVALFRLIDLVGIPDRVIIDGEDKNIHGAEFYPKADGNYPCVMAASIIAKVFRDDHMKSVSSEYPQYGFAKNVGYGTEDHRLALQEHGPCPLHRRSYAPIRSLSSI